jgi:hypothetical protein
MSGILIKFLWNYSELFGRSPSGRAIRCNALFVASQNISTAIPNAKQKTRVHLPQQKSLSAGIKPKKKGKKHDKK